MIDALVPLLRETLAGLSAYRVPAAPPPVKLDANESPWPLSAAARKLMADRLSSLDFHRYPDGRAEALRAALSATVGGHPDALVFGSGSDEVIALLMTALCRPREGAKKAKVLFPAPTFVMYGITSRALGLEPVAVELDETWNLDEQAMDAALREHRPNLVFYASPNNPTANRFDDAVLRRLVEAHPDVVHIIDEAYGAFADRSCYDWCEQYPQVGVLGTLSKIGLAAARVGWVRLHPWLAGEVDKVRQPFNLNALSQLAATLTLTELRGEFDERVAQVRAERQRLSDEIAGLPGLHAFPSEANFIFTRVGDAAPGRDQALAEALLVDGVAVRSFHKYGGRLAGHVRLTVGTPDENDTLLAALRNRLPDVVA